jgi:hypothetical protein
MVFNSTFNNISVKYVAFSYVDELSIRRLLFVYRLLQKGDAKI